MWVFQRLVSPSLLALMRATAISEPANNKMAENVSVRRFFSVQWSNIERSLMGEVLGDARAGRIQGTP